MDPLAELIGESPGMVALRGQVTRLLRHHARSHRLPPVLLQGETGTGKGVLASALHRASPRAESSFVAVNCAAIPETLLEAEMFGFERGAFTDARQAKPGLFQAAHRGTIFLDEIGLLPEGLQAKLLKAIEEREVRRLGSTRSESVDVWILTAASEDLARARHARHFHEALYHRLSVLTFCLPPLRERGDDVLLLARHFLDRVCREYGMPTTTFAPGVEAALRAHPWPGNVRELGNAIERAALLSGGGPVTVETLGLEPAPAGGHGRATRGAAVNLGEAVDTVEREHILAALTETRWNVSHAAARLGIPRTSLVYRIQKHGLSPPKAARRHRRVLPRPEHPERTTVAFTAPDMRWERRQLALLRVAGGTAGGAPASAAVAALEALLGKVQSFGGRLEEIGPSGLMATFGLEPIEDAPVRAAHAAMAMQKAAERARRAAVPAFRLTVAIHCGPVMTAQVQGGWQIALEDKRAAVGLLDALVEQAAPDTIVVSPAAARLLARRFQLEPVTAAGGGSDEPAYRLAGLESTGLGLGGRALSRFVGRDRELTALHDLLRRVERGAGQAVGLMGEPGVGKSRVLYEFRQSLTGAGLAYLEGHCLSYRSTTPYGPLLDVLRQACGVTEDDLPPVVSQTLRARLEGLGLDPDVDAPYLLHALGLTEGTEGLALLSPETVKIGTFEALRRLVLRQGRGRPAVLAIEDLHWIDRTSEEFLASLVDGLAGVPVLVVASYRPGYRPSWMDRSYVTQLTLPELSPEDSRAIVESALGAAAGPLALTEAIVKRAEGNPFFLEELAWAIAERASAHEPASIPETVQGALLGRIDRLPQARRRLLQTASVLGRGCPARLLRAVWEDADDMTDHLRELQRLEFLYERPGVEEPLYVFKHALTQEVAYESLPSERRRLLHRRAVGALESLHAERRVEHVDELAHHAVRGELWEQALAYLRQAGARAAARSGFREATAHLEGALRVLAHLPESRDVLEQAIDVRVELRNALLPVGEEARIFAYLREAEAIAEALGDERRLGTVFLARTFHLIMMGAHQEALECCRRALAVATAIGSFPLEVRAKYYLGGIYEYLGDYGRAIESLRETAARLDGERIREQLGSTGYPSVLSRAWLVWCLAEVGEFAEAVARGEEMVRIAETLDDRYSSIAAYRSVGQTHLNRGDIPAAIAALERCVGLLGAAEFPRWVFGTTTLLGYAYVLSGRLFEAEPLLKQALARETPVRSTHHARLVACLGEAYLLAGHRDDAIRLAGRALSLARQRKEHSHEAHALRLLGEIDFRRDPPDLEQAEGHYRQALELAETLGMRPLAAHCRLGLGRVHGRAGRRPAAEAHLGAAVLLFRGLDMGYWLEQAESELEAIP